MSMLPKIDISINVDGQTKDISTMGDTTHVMVNGFCYHIGQMQEGELKDECVALLKTAKAMANQPEPRRGLRNMDGTIEYFTGEF